MSSGGGWMMSFSGRVFWTVAPLVLVSLMVVLVGQPDAFNWVMSSHHFWLGKYSISKASSSITNMVVSSSSNSSSSSQLKDRENRHVSNKSDNIGLSKHKQYSRLEKLEARLQQARIIIRNGKRDKIQHDHPDPDYTPNGPMYWNSSSFHRSYIEMEKEMKVYVYKEGDPPVFHNGPCVNTYAIEGLFINNMEISHFRTEDPNKAHVFFLPYSTTMITKYVYNGDHRWEPMKAAAMDYVTLITSKYPYWNRSLGADHFIVGCHDWSPEISFAIPNLYNNSIRALCNANTSERFNPARDVSIPEIRLTKGMTLGGLSPSQRSILVFFAGGGDHGPIRPILLQHWENKDPDVQIHKYLPKKVSYFGMMRKSKYCICASGYEVASPRMVEALYMGCVPVLIKDHYSIPFSDVLNWKTFAVIIPKEEIQNLKKILTSISSRQYIRMQRRGTQMRRHFEVNTPPRRYDVFHMILHSIWLRRLNIRLYDTI
ncbi:probable glycosyltransferase At5g03795 [Impatiens glandulifera]|uniref:probable glycosyltransferase At5g03795 n=1 Tax=Impatiens glandulifera TaxID=253017 RepID=UPI001FB11C5B|nr:probable glycosyltransferase At5g03795 [Impatiens glandulifera]